MPAIAANTQAGYKLVTSDLSVSELGERMAQGVVNVGKMIVTIQAKQSFKWES